MLDLDKIIETIRTGGTLDESDIVQVVRAMMGVLYMESSVLELRAPITICGDIHGQLEDLFELFDKAGGVGTDTFLFMGDYVDRGYYSMDTLMYLLTLKLKYPDKFFLLRGNHESRQVTGTYGFYDECLVRYGHSGIWLLCNELFDLLPMAALVDNAVFCVHGGLSPDIPIVEKITLLNRNQELPTSGPLCDLCWSDPGDVDRWETNSRGAGYIFGARQAAEFCHLNGNLEFVARSHQLAEKGFSWACDNKVITVWSAPNYMYKTNNRASVMKYKGRGIEPELVLFDANTTRRPRDDSTNVVKVVMGPKSYFA